MSTKIFVCPKCGTELSRTDETGKPTDLMQCPVHGIIGTVEEVVARARRGLRDGLLSSTRLWS
jgi:hypothetical protein